MSKHYWGPTHETSYVSELAYCHAFYALHEAWSEEEKELVEVELMVYEHPYDQMHRDLNIVTRLEESGYQFDDLWRKCTAPIEP
jgi:hypothetical protein